MFINLPSTADDFDESNVRMRCACGTEYAPARVCPVCGATVPVMVTMDGVVWKTMADLKADSLRKALAPGALNDLPEPQREKIRAAIQANLDALESQHEEKRNGDIP